MQTYTESHNNVLETVTFFSHASVDITFSCVICQTLKPLSITLPQARLKSIVYKTLPVSPV